MAVMRHGAWWAALLALSMLGCGASDTRWNVLIVTLDTTRADVLGCYGRDSARTDNLDRLAAEGFLFEQAISAAPITMPSHSTIMTGTYPPAHGVRDNGHFRLPDEAVTLAEILAEQGYRTGAAIGAFPLDRQFGIDQGFEKFDDDVSSPDEVEDPIRRRGLFFDERPADAVNEALFGWLEEVHDEPFFAWLHYFDAHQPLTPPAPFSDLFQHDLYQGEVAFVDQSFGAVRRRLEDWGVWDRTLVVVVGDHGEGRGEHGEDTHSMLAYDSTLRVPFLLLPAKRMADDLAPSGRVEQRVGTVDIVPTILELLGLPALQQAQGRSLVPLLHTSGASGGRDLYYAETLAPRVSQGMGELRVLYEGRHKLIHGPEPELFDLEADPRELKNLVAREPELALELEARLQDTITALSSRAAAAAAHGLDDESRRRLEALGYLSADGAGAVVEEVLSKEGIAPRVGARDNMLMSLCKQLLQRGDYLAARDLAEQLVERAPGHSYYRSLLVSALLGLNRVDEAGDVLEEDLEVASRNEGAFLETIRRLFEAKDESRAEALLTRSLEERASGGGYYLLGEMKRHLGERDEALVHLEQALEIEPDLATARLSAAVLRSQMDPTDATVDTHFEHLIEIQPMNPRVHFNYGVALNARGALESARARVAHAVALHPTYCQARSALLTIELGLGDPDRIAQARQGLQRACPSS